MPLPPELLDEIKKRIKDGKERIKVLKPEIEKAKMAGIDVAAEKKELAKLEKAILDLELQYGK